MAEQPPATSKHIIVFIAEVDATQEPVSVTPGRCPDTDIAVMVATTRHTRLVGYSESETPVIPPE